LTSLAVSISRQLEAWANSLQNSQIKGQRYATQKTRQASEANRQREEFLEELRRMQEDRIAQIQKPAQSHDKDAGS
jgi:2-succinyl-5-enolpyruvyl-6-hydroxy-3-cyclohexene-1-carboxylate synthase